MGDLFFDRPLKIRGSRFNACFNRMINQAVYLVSIVGNHHFHPNYFFGRMGRLIQFVTFSSPSWRSPTTIQKARKFTGTQKGSRFLAELPRQKLVHHQKLSPLKINGWNISSLGVVWFRSFSFLFMGDGCKFQSLIF